MAGIVSKVIRHWVPGAGSSAAALIPSRMIASSSGGSPSTSSPEGPDLLTRMELKAVEELQGMVAATSSSGSAKPAAAEDTTAKEQSSQDSPGQTGDNSAEHAEQGGPTGKEPTRFGEGLCQLPSFISSDSMAEEVDSCLQCIVPYMLVTSILQSMDYTTCLSDAHHGDATGMIMRFFLKASKHR